MVAALVLAGTAAASGAERQWGPFRGANSPPTLSEEDVRYFAALGGNLLRIINNSRPLMSKQAPYEFDFPVAFP